MIIDRPIFILGPGRSGTTILNTLLTHHRDVGYVVSWSNKYPQLAFLAVGAYSRSVWYEKKYGLGHYYPGPTEPYSVWKYCFPNFWKVNRAPCADTAGAERLRRIMTVHLKLQRRSRFLTKVTGPPIFQFLVSMFPDARFVWIDRDPRAVCYSYFRRGWIGVPPERRGQLTDDEQLQCAATRYLSFYEQLEREETPNYTMS